MSEGSDPIYVMDEFDLRPGMLEPFLAALAADYEPGARKRGMHRLHTWVTPPLELVDGGTQVLIVWQLDGVSGFWEMRRANAQPSVAAWWRDCERFVSARTRRYAADASALATLEAAGNQHA